LVVIVLARGFLTLRFSKFFGTTPEFWLNLQNYYDMEEKGKNLKKELELITPMKIAN